MNLETARTIATFISAIGVSIGAAIALLRFLMDGRAREAKIDYCHSLSGKDCKYKNIEDKVAFSIAFQGSGEEPFKIEEGLFAHFALNKDKGLCPKPSRIAGEQDEGPCGRIIHYGFDLPAERDTEYIIATKLRYKGINFLSRSKSKLFLFRCKLINEGFNQFPADANPSVSIHKIDFIYEYNEIKEKLPKDFD